MSKLSTSKIGLVCGCIVITLGLGIVVVVLVRRWVCYELDPDDLYCMVDWYFVGAVLLVLTRCVLSC